MNKKAQAMAKAGKMLLLVSLLFSLFWFSPQSQVTAEAEGPNIDVWYGDVQYFGDPGLPGRQIYILGNVSDSDGVKSLAFSLNNGAFELLQLGPFPVSPHGPRLLYGAGDFAVELFDGELREGINTLVLRAIDNSENTTERTVLINYTHNKKWPLPTTTTWGVDSGTWQKQAQVLTGKWDFAAGSVRTNQVGYDRMIAIGDMGWRDYEVRVDVTINDVDDAQGFNEPSNGPGVGLLLRWTGHTDEPYSDVGSHCYPEGGLVAPKCGYLPYGAIGWLRWQDPDDLSDVNLQLLINNPLIPNETPFSLGSTITFTYKMRVETLNDGRPKYSLKVWRAENPEPSSWSLVGEGKVGDPISGSVVLLAHHVDATFSDVTVTPLELDLPASSAQSDDFNMCSLDTTRWTLINPVGDGNQGIGEPYTNDAHLFLSLPASVEHDMNARDDSGGNKTMRIVQMINDTDFIFEAKFDSSVQSSSSNIRPFQGMMVEENASPAKRWIRADFYSQGNGTRLYVATYEGALNVRSGSEEGKLVWFDAPVIEGNPTPLYLRMERYGSRWIISIKGPSDPDWQTVVNVPFLVQAARVGLYAGNAYGSNSPEFAAKIDYFQNLASPISDEDALRNTLTINVNPTGGGTVIKAPDLGEYNCGQTVGLVANANPGHTFANWSGDLNGTNPSGSVVMNGPKVISANFSSIPYTLTVNVIGNGTVTKNPDKATYVYGDEVTLTALPQAGWSFSGWSGGASGSAGSTTVTITGNTTVGATFTQDQYTLTVNVIGGGTVTKSPDKATYTYGEAVTLTANPQSTWTFVGWSGGLSGLSNPVTLTMSGNTTIQATFSTNRVFIPLVLR
ncbi:hypothetical protein QYE77_01690 [Thermanaerothrix sp. 4228-RoL]|uniref:Bacterial repeat domain-containing protein n=1 Tax=Thermanaerothrix solaris TaxID=3058434 RepID=A0ABU3NJC9_9CHLR|nr:hypothetical protein [Thermanaerothrix sp. 4228-RoL]MDT8896960.1 hypothetical protein [Thermanaerothrix sp. 4228-RoL]